MRVCLQGFNYRINYVPGKNAGSENNEADYNSRHPKPLARQEGRTSSNQAEFELRETEGEFEKNMMAIVKLSVPKVIEETLADRELSSLKDAIARGYFTAGEMHACATI